MIKADKAHEHGEDDGFKADSLSVSSPHSSLIAKCPSSYQQKNPRLRAARVLVRKGILLLSGEAV